MVHLELNFENIVFVLARFFSKVCLLGAARQVIYCAMQVVLNDDMFNDRIYWFLLCVWFVPVMIKVIQHGLDMTISARANFFLLVLAMICMTITTNKQAKKRGTFDVNEYFTKGLDNAKYLMTICFLCDFF